MLPNASLRIGGEEELNTNQSRKFIKGEAYRLTLVQFLSM